MKTQQSKNLCNIRREVYSDTSLSKERRKVSSKKPKLTPKGKNKEQTKSKFNGRKKKL